MLGRAWLLPVGSVVLVAMTGCGDGGTEYDPDCHWDCFGHSECHDGVVTTWAHTPVPCEYWTWECPHHESYTCERGCRLDTDVIHDPWIDPSEMCEEWRPKQVGDPCDDPTDCEPQIAAVDDAGNVLNVYLRCDLEADTCVARDPPVVEDYLAQCGVEPSFDGPRTGAYGFVRTDVCSGGVCLVYEATTCVTQGCTIRCDSDDDCPMGSVCWFDGRDWTPAGPGSDRAVCKPGPPGFIGVDLACP
ncbi:MAG: hypothetical protein HY905_08385 [Deltaproteobacteria bacterium]|nr:hypothetical protein [Deltaproteobacteria bacterium]